MNIKRTAWAAAIAAAAWGCAGPKQQLVKPSPVAQAPAFQDSLQQMEKLSAELKSAPAPLAAALLPPVPGLSAAALEPALCARRARLAGSAPVFDAQALSCYVGWMRSAQDYLYRGGAPTKYTNREEFESTKKEALEMLAAQTKWLTDAKWEAKADPTIAIVAANSGPASSQQRYLDGVIAFQKGDNVRARAAWTDALKLDPSNSDAQAGLELLDKRVK